MKQKIILDTSFILTAVRNKIDIFEELIEFEIIIPTEVINEIRNQNTDNSRLALKILQDSKFKKIELGAGHVDKLIINFAIDNPKVIVATLDREIKKAVKNPKMVIRERKRLGVI